MTDAGAEYLLKRESSSRASALEELISRVESAPPGGEESPPAPKEQGVTAFGIAKDIGGGLVESPKQIAGGVNEAVVNALKLADPLVNWLEKNVAELPRYEIPDVSPAKTVTGNVIREGARFMTGFIPAFRTLKGIGLGTGAASVLGGGASEAITADPSGPGLSNLIQGVPALENPVTEFLSTNPDDPEALNRLRKGVEGAGFGILAEGITYGIKAAVKASGKKALDPLAEAKARYGEVKDSDFSILGDAKEPAIFTKKIEKATKKTEDVTPAGFSEIGQSAGDGVYVNWLKIETEDDIKNMMKKATDLFAKDIVEAKRGVRTHEMTERAAEALGMSVETLLSRRGGQAFNAEELKASTALWISSAEKLFEVSDRAMLPNAGIVDQVNFRKMMAIHYAIQAEALGARAEAGRALEILSTTTKGGGVERARAIGQLIDSLGGPHVSQEMAKRISMLGKGNASPQAIALVVRKGWGATTMDAVKESFVNGLLWSPATHAVNTTSNLAFQVQNIAERQIASEVSQFVGRAPGEGVHPGEAMSMAYGLVSGLRDAIRVSGKALRTGEQTQGRSKIDLPPEPAISTQAIAREKGMSASELEAFQETNLGKSIDFLGTATRAPGKLLMAEDEFFKSTAYRMELHAQSVRMAASEGKTGADLYKRMAEIVNDPPENVRLSAADAALYMTFQNEPGIIAQSLMRIRHAGTLNPTVLFLPFIRTPANLFNRSFERSPLGPLMTSVRDDFAAGGARADLAAARIATGSAIMAVAGDLAYSGLISGVGPDDPGEREALERQGWQKFSINTGDKWVQYGRLDPMGMTLGVAATFAEMSKRFDIEPEEMDEFSEIAGAAVAAVSKSVINRTYLEGMSRIVDAIASGDQNPRQVAKIIEDTAASLVPFTTALATAKKAVDPTQRETDTIWEAIQARLVGLSEKLKPARDLWGKEKAPDEIYGRFVDVITPMSIRGIKDSPIDKEITRLNADIQRIPSKLDFQGVPINLRDFSDVKDEYERLAGNELKLNGLGAKDMLNSIVTGEHALSSVYESLPDTEEGKGAFIKDVISRYRGAAKMQILNDPKFSDFREHWDQRRIELMQKRNPQ